MLRLHGNVVLAVLGGGTVGRSIDTEHAELKETVSGYMEEAYGKNGFLYVMQHVNGLKNIELRRNIADAK